MVTQGAVAAEDQSGAVEETVPEHRSDLQPSEGTLMGPAQLEATQGIRTVNSKAKKKPRASLPAVPTRTLRHRTSLPAPTYSTSTIEEVKEKLAPRGITAFREEKLKDREVQVREVVDIHDGLIRERFHLERFVSILEGYDPVAAKKDNSNVFLEYRMPYDLVNKYPHLTPQPTAGPSRHAGQINARTTRRAAAERTEALIGVPAPPVEQSTPKAKGKGKARAEPEDSVEIKVETPASVGKKRKAKEMLPPPVPISSKLRRSTMGGATQPVPDLTPPATPVGGKKRGRQPRSSLPARLGAAADVSPSPPIYHTSPPPQSALVEARLPSLSHLPFPPPPKRQPSILYQLAPPRYTDPTQRPPNPRFDLNPEAYLESYMQIDDNNVEMKALDQRAARDARARNRLAHLQSLGRMLHVQAELDSDPSLGTVGAKPSANAFSTKPPIEFKRVPDHQDALLSHMLQIRNAMITEAKAKPVVCRKLAKAVQQYWERLEGRDEHSKKEEERQRKALVRSVVRSIKQKWKLAAKVVRQQKEMEKKAEQDRLGKQHLQSILERSTGLLEQQREDLTRKGRSRSGTEEVSAAEDSEADEEDADDENGEEDGEDDAVVNGEELEPTVADIVNGEPAASSPLPGDERLKGLTQDSSVAPSGSATPAASTPALASSPAPSVPINTKSSKARDYEDEVAAAEDAELDVEMEDAEGAEDNEEDDGLLADADLPIEELLRRYGYPASALGGAEEAVDEAEENEQEEPMEVDAEDQATEDVDAEVDEVANGTPDVGDAQDASLEEKAADVVADVRIPVADQSLTDTALEEQSVTLTTSKRQRRPRAVWTPEPTPRPKIVEIKAVRSSPEPEDALDEEEQEEEDEDEEEEDGSQAGSDMSVASPERDENGQPRVRPPFLLRGTLRPYQQAGLEWLASLHTNNMNGILADEMGLGKTIQTIALLAHLACDKGIWGQHLIIVPTSVILNWEMEFKKFFPGMKVLTYYGNQKERKDRRVGWNSENSFQVCITSYQIVLADQHIFRRKTWQYMILDEAHNIKNFRSQRWQTLLGFKSYRRLLLTGTPLQNNLMELWSLLYFLMPNGISSDASVANGFANHKEFSEWFSNPMDKAVEAGETMDEETLATISRLHTLLRPFLLRRLKSEVETQLPGKFEHVVYCRLSKRQRFLYDEFMSRASTRDALTNGGYLGVVNTLMQLRKVCNHPDLFEVRPVRTSFAMERSVMADMEPVDLLVRKRLLNDEDRPNLMSLNLKFIEKERESAFACRSRARLNATSLLPEGAIFGTTAEETPEIDARTVEGWRSFRHKLELRQRAERWHGIRRINHLRCTGQPIYGETLYNSLSDIGPRMRIVPESVANERPLELLDEHLTRTSAMVRSLTDRAQLMAPIIDKFAVIPPNAVACDVPTYALPGLTPTSHPDLLDPSFDSLHQPTVKLQIAFPDASLLQYDCGKLQKLYEMLRDLKAGGHRVLIFTQMTKVLDILEMFLSYNGHRYLRLDGSTKIEDRQIITERFNTDSRIFVFIASSRSGGVGINLTGADTVFFYDSDWNPSMDRQCMDRAHRIGQTREVHIYRFVSSHTVEENMLKKANQKRLLDNVVIQQGDFTTEFFGKMDWRDMLDDGSGDVVDVDVEPEEEQPAIVAPGADDLTRAFAQVEDEEDAAAAQVAQHEGNLDAGDFAVPTGDSVPVKKVQVIEPSASATPAPAPEDEEEDEDDLEGEPGSVDEYMLRFVQWDWEFFA